jgi:hypothetical protein
MSSSCQHEDPGVDLGSGELIASTERALLIKFSNADYNETEQGTWVPKSQMHPDSALDGHYQYGVADEVTVTDWFAKKRGWA